MNEFAEMTKTELRAACKDAGIPNYGKMTVDAMRDALTAQVSVEQVVDEQPVEQVVEEATNPTAKPKVQRETRNGVTRPSAGGKCAAVWDHLDANPTSTAKEIREVAVAQGWNVANAMCELYVWRKFNGVAGRQKA